MKGFSSFSGLAADGRSVMRGLVRKPGYPIAAWVMLGLAIAANAAVFAIVYGFLLKPLPYTQPNQLSVVRARLPAIGQTRSLVSVKSYLTLKRNLDGISNAGLFTWPVGSPATIDGKTQLIGYQRVTPSLFRTLDVQPVVGRLPAANADQPGGPPEAVISYLFWQLRLGGEKNILDQSLRVGKQSYRIVGVMPRNFFLDYKMSAWLPLVMTTSVARNSTDINYWMTVRRKPGVSQHQLDLELQRARASIQSNAAPWHQAYLEKGGYEIDAKPVHAMFLAQFGVGGLPWLLQAAAGLLLLLAIANTVNLGLVRQRARQHEFALRRVLGSSRSGLVRLILIEHLPIALAVGGTATLLAWIATRALHAFGLPPALSPFQVVLTSPVIVFTWVLTAVAMMAVTFGPALISTGQRLFKTLGHGPTATGGKGPRRLQRTLGTVQIALACALVIAGGLLGTSLWRVLAQPLGFKPTRRIAAMVFTPHDTDTRQAWTKLKPRLMALPEVKSATATNMLPFSSIGHPMDTAYPVGTGKEGENIRVNDPSIDADFFSVMHIPFVAGHAFGTNAIANHVPETVINATLAKRFFGSAEKAIGQTIHVGADYRVVGVTRNIVWNPQPKKYPSGTAYHPRRSGDRDILIAVMQTHGVTAPFMASLRRTIKQTLPHSAVYKIVTLPQLVQGASVFRAAGAGMVITFAALALLLAALGVFAITALIARARLGEYGIRAALGASPGALLRLGFREAAWLLAIGLPLGLAGAYLLGHVIASALYQTPVFDIGLYVAGIVIIAAVVFAAAWGPAHHAARAPIRDLIGGGSST
ncbi:MAG: ABC transporter permease [Gammaproteobacteria bacterium]